MINATQNNISSNLPLHTNQPQTTGLSPVNVSPSNCALYIGDLHNDVTEAILFQFVSTSGVNIISARVCRSNTTKKSLNYGYLNFSSKEDADKSMDFLNFQPLMGRPVRMMHCQRDPSLRKSGKGNIIIKNLHTAVQPRMLLDIMKKIGPVYSLALKSDSENPSTKNAYIQFENEEHAATAVQALDKTKLSNAFIEVKPFVAQKEIFEKRDAHEKTFVNCYVKNLPKNEFKTEEQLEKYFSRVGEITSCKLVRDSNDQPSGAAFICFAEHESAVKACDEYDGQKLDDDEDSKPIVFNRFMRKNERYQLLKEKYDGLRVTKHPNNNIYIKNLDVTVTDDTLLKEFSNFGKVISAKVMTHDNNQSRGFGFVSFENPKDAATAIEKKHGAYFFCKPLHVEWAQKKEERQLNLRNQFRSPQYFVNPQAMPYMLKQPGTFFAPQNYMPMSNYQMYPGSAGNNQNRYNKNYQQMNHQNNHQRQNHFQNHHNGANNGAYGVDRMNKSKNLFQIQNTQKALTDSEKNNFGQEFNALLREMNKPHLIERANKIIGVLLDAGVHYCQALLDNPESFKKTVENIYQQLRDQEINQHH